MKSILKGKKIVAYIALKHHTRFIIPIMKNLHKLGADTHYVIGQAERSQEITAIETGLEYSHVYSYIRPENRDEIHNIYKNLRDGFVAGLKKDVALGAASMPTVLDKNLYNTAMEYVGFRNFFQKEKPDLCLALHEVNRWGKMMGFWAKKNHVPFFTLIEGLSNATDYHFIGHVQYSCAGLVWGESMRKKLIGFEAPRDRIIPVGNTHLAAEKENLEKNNIGHLMKTKYNLEHQLTVLLIFSAKPPKIEEILPILALNETQGDKKIIIKFHPVTTALHIEKWLETVPEGIKQNTIMIHGEETVYSLIALCDLVVIAEPSTTGLETIVFGKPLVQLKLPKPDQYPYTFVEDGVAAHLTPEELEKIIMENHSFNQLIDQNNIDRFLKKELEDTSHAIDTIVDIFNQSLTAVQHTKRPSVKFQNEASMDWSVILPVGREPDHFLAVLESISVFSEGNGSFEVILLIPDKPAPEIKQILDTLEGDLQIITLDKTDNLPAAYNKGAALARGETLLFFDINVSPTEGWLSVIASEFDHEKTGKIVGGLIVNQHKNIIHAGMVVDSNHSPVSAYQHLDEKFPAALKRRPFQMINYFAAVNRDLFSRLEGFQPKSGQYAFPDLCLAAKSLNPANPVEIIFNPNIKLIKNDLYAENTRFDETIYFYSKWQGAMWASENDLYKKDGISQLQLDSARMTRAVETVRG